MKRFCRTYGEPARLMSRFLSSRKQAKRLSVWTVSLRDAVYTLTPAQRHLPKLWPVSRLPKRIFTARSKNSMSITPRGVSVNFFA